MPSQKKKTTLRLITAEDLYRFHLVTSCEISPDGSQVVYALQHADQKTEKKFSNLWIVPTAGGDPRQVTFGDQLDSQPRWSPQGDRLAFISNRKEEKQPQLYILPLSGGEARPLNELQGEIGYYEWSPDGRQLVLQFRKKDAEAVEREKDDHKKELGIVSRHIRRVFYKLDGYGYLPVERWHIWTVDSQTGKTRQVTEGPICDEVEPRWSPDGRQILFCSNHASDPDLDPDAFDLFILDVKTGSCRKLETAFGNKRLPSFSPDGRWVAYVSQEGRAEGWRNSNLWLAPIDCSSPAVNLTASFDFQVCGGTLNDTGSASSVSPTWSKDCQTLYFQVAEHGNVVLKSINPKTRALENVIDERGVVGHYSFDRTGARLAYFHGEMSDPGQVCLQELPAASPPRKLTAINHAWLKSVDLGEIEECWFKGPANNDLQGWILKPPGFNPAQKYPSILEIHGGPLTQYGNYFMHEFYYLAAQGDVVYFCNPRGGRGYGESHARANHAAWGTVDYDDLMAWADYMVRKPYIDPERMGVTGGSYGGYMTNWIIGHTHRFKAAVTTRSVSNLISMWGSSDYNWSFQEIFGNQAPFESIEKVWEMSPMKHIGYARTPTLVIHNQQDLRCAIEQGEQVFVALKKLGVETELVIFPDEPHGLSRIGRTDRRIERLNCILGWFDRYLKPK